MHRGSRGLKPADSLKGLSLCSTLVSVRCSSLFIFATTVACLVLLRLPSRTLPHHMPVLSAIVTALSVWRSAATALCSACPVRRQPLPCLQIKPSLCVGLPGCKYRHMVSTLPALPRAHPHHTHTHTRACGSTIASAVFVLFARLGICCHLKQHSHRNTTSGSACIEAQRD